jgi:hypothetical protein
MESAFAAENDFSRANGFYLVALKQSAYETSRQHEASAREPSCQRANASSMLKASWSQTGLEQQISFSRAIA